MSYCKLNSELMKYSCYIDKTHELTFEVTIDHLLTVGKPKDRLRFECSVANCKHGY